MIQFYIVCKNNSDEVYIVMHFYFVYQLKNACSFKKLIFS